MVSLSSKQRSCVILVAWKFLSVLLICKNLGSLLKAVDLHINDISVTEKEGAAAPGRMSSALNQMLQVCFQLRLPVCPMLKSMLKARGEKSRSQEHTRSLR